MRASTLILLASSLALACSSEDEPTASTEQAAFVFPAPIVKAAAGATVVGTLSGTFEVTGDGAASFTVPLTVPPGRAGMQPDLALVYSSRGGNGLVGVGWSLAGLSQISRCGSTYFHDRVARPVDYAHDHYCLDGMRLLQIASAPTPFVGCAIAHEYRTEPETQQRVVTCGEDTLGPIAWLVYAPSGRVSFYGFDASNRIEVTVRGLDANGGETVTSTRRTTWLLQRVEDHGGNYMTYTYGSSRTTDRVEWWPARIDYTGYSRGSTVAAPTRSVLFDYGKARADAFSTFEAGVEIAHTHLLARVTMQAPDAAEQLQAAPLAHVRQYRLGFTTSGPTSRRLLTSLAMCNGFADDSNASECLPPTTFTYEQPTIAFAQSSQGLDAASGRLFGIDLDNNARDDLYYIVEGSGGTRTEYVKIAGGTVAAPLYGAAAPQALGIDRRLPGRLGYDATADQRVDAIAQTCTSWVCPEGGTCRDADKVCDAPEIAVFASTGSGFALNGTRSSCDGATCITPDLIADFNGDLVPDAWSGSGYMLGIRGGAARALGTDPLGHVFGGTPHYADVDGDGQLDMMWPRYPTNQYDAVHLRGVPGNEIVEANLTNFTRSTGNCDLFMDVNGDGLADAVNIQDGALVRLNRGDGRFTAATNWAPAFHNGGICATLAQPNNPFAGYRSAGVYPVDLNDDGRQDLLVLQPITSSSQNESGFALISTGAGFVQLELHIPYAVENNTRFCARWGGPPTAVPLDANGDGHVDIMFACNGEWILQTQQRPGSTTSAGNADVLVEIRDGRGAIVRNLNYRVTTDPLAYSSTNTTWKQPLLVVSSESIDDGAGNLITIASHRYSDGTMTGDPEGWLGFAKHTTIDPRSSARRVVTYATEGANAAGEPLARSVGGYLDGRPFHPFKGQVLDETTTVTVNGLPLSTKTTYVPAVIDVVYPSGVQNYFTYVRRTTASSFDNTTQLAATTTDTRVNTCGAPRSVVVDREPGAPVARTTTTATTYQVALPIADPSAANPACAIGGGWSLLRTAERVTSTASGQSQVRETAWVYEADDSGRVRDTQIQPSGPADQASCTRVFTRDQFGNPTVVDVTPGTSCARVTQTGGVPTKLLTRTTRTVYNSVATAAPPVYEGVFAIQTTDPLGNTTTTQIHPGLGVVYGVTDADGRTEVRRFDGFGRPVRVDYPDGSNAWPSTINTVTSYNAPNAPLLVTCNTDGYTAASFSEIELSIATTGAVSFTCRDRLARSARSATVLPFGGPFGAGASSYVDTTYDLLFPDRVMRVTRPHLAGGATPTASENVFDNAGRISRIRKAKPDDPTQLATTTITYRGLTVETCEGLRVRRRQVRAPYGPVASSAIFPDATSCTNGTAATTTFTYGPFDTLTAATDAAGNVVTQEFDALGRRTRLVDGDLGTVLATYTSLGQVDTETNGLGRAELVYDLLGRLSTRTAPDGVDSYVYDPAGARGKLASSRRMATHVVERHYTYDTLGRLARRDVQIDGGVAYDTLTSYDAQGHVSGRQTPSVAGLGRIATHHSYRNDHLVTIELGRTSATCTATSQCPAGETCLASLGNVCGKTAWSLSAVDPEGRPATETTGDGVTTSYTYKAGNVGDYTATLGGAVVQKETYNYDDAGSLSRRTDERLGANETFGYDGADRLTSTQVSGRVAQSYRFDAIGNLTYASDIVQVGCTGATFHYDKTYVYGTVGPHALTSLTTCNGSQPLFTYDGAGNHRNGTDGRDVFTWTTFGKMATSSNALVAFANDYDADHNLVQRRRTAGADPYHAWDTVVIADSLERRLLTGGGEDDVLTIPLGNTTVEVAWNGATRTTRYLHADRLGSPVLITDASGNVIERRSFDAWGMMRGADMVSAGPWPLTTSSTFTGHDYRFGTWIGDGVYFIDMGGRMYQPQLKRFWSPDPYVQAPTFGPSWNRYSYTFGNPLRFTDPSGYLTADTTLSLFFSKGSGWSGADIIAAGAAGFDEAWNERMELLVTARIIARQAQQALAQLGVDGRQRVGPPPTQGAEVAVVAQSNSKGGRAATWQDKGTVSPDMLRNYLGVLAQQDLVADMLTAQLTSESDHRERMFIYAKQTDAGGRSHYVVVYEKTGEQDARRIEVPVLEVFRAWSDMKRSANLERWSVMFHTHPELSAVSGEDQDTSLMLAAVSMVTSPMKFWAFYNQIKIRESGRSSRTLFDP
ncbi:MAG TPA: SpvB/TcaC N-terminal domain-containing protein [Kofleriaceae bacterium]